MSGYLQYKYKFVGDPDVEILDWSWIFLFQKYFFHNLSFQFCWCLTLFWGEFVLETHEIY